MLGQAYPQRRMHIHCELRIGNHLYFSCSLATWVTQRLQEESSQSLIIPLHTDRTCFLNTFHLIISVLLQSWQFVMFQLLAIMYRFGVVRDCCLMLSVLGQQMAIQTKCKVMVVFNHVILQSTGSKADKYDRMDQCCLK